MSSTRILPRGVSAATFAKAMAEFRTILGEDRVFDSEERLAGYSRTTLPGSDDERAPSAAIAATSVEEIQSILRVCNRYRIPLWTISTGKNLGYGSAAPVERGQVILDLKRMNRILEINAELGYALVEPGVTYQQLFDYIEEHKLPLWLDCPEPSAIVGPVGNTLERGAGSTPYADHFSMACGMEVVLATGEVLRTGMGSIPNTRSWQAFKWGYGPWLDGLFTQSNYGIVTKLGFWLMPAPPAYKPYCVQYEREEDLAHIIDAFRPLRLSSVTGGVVAVSAVTELMEHTRSSDLYAGEGAVPLEILREAARKSGVGAWNVYSALYGSPEHIEHSWKFIEQFVARGGRGRILTDAEGQARSTFRMRSVLMRGGLNLNAFGMYNWRGGGGVVYFSPVGPAIGADAQRQRELAGPILRKHGLDYGGLFAVGSRDLHHIIAMVFDKENPKVCASVHECYLELLREFTAAGYGIYRTSTEFMDAVADTYGETRRSIARKIKRALDPNGILAPGKSGIRI